MKKSEVAKQLRIGMERHQIAEGQRSLNAMYSRELEWAEQAKSNGELSKMRKHLEEARNIREVYVKRWGSFSLFYDPVSKLS